MDEKHNLFTYLISKGVTHVKYGDKLLKIYPDRIGLIKYQPMSMIIKPNEAYIRIGDYRFDFVIKDNDDILNDFIDNKLTFKYNMMWGKGNKLLMMATHRSLVKILPVSMIIDNNIMVLDDSAINNDTLSWLYGEKDMLQF